jgi:hypothetical protein
MVQNKYNRSVPAVHAACSGLCRVIGRELKAEQLASKVP